MIIVVLACAAIAPSAQAGKGSKISLSGRVEMSHSDSFSTRNANFERFIVVGKRKYRLTGRKAAALAPGAKVKVAGRKTGVDVDIDGVTTLEQRNVPAVASASSRSLRAATVEKRVAIVPFRYLNDPPAPAGPEISERLFGVSPAKSVSTFFKEVSGGQLQLTAVIFIPVTINQNRPAGCNWEGQFVPQAKALVPPGNSLYSFDLQVYISPPAAACGNVSGASKWGSPQSFSFINGLPATQEGATRVVAHELGHQLYLDHASAYLCDPRNPIQPQGSTCRSEYGDPFDAMSNSMSGTAPIPVRQFSGFHKAQLESRGGLAEASVQSVTKTGTYQLAPSNVTGASKPTLLAITAPTVPRTRATTTWRPVPEAACSTISTAHRRQAFVTAFRSGSVRTTPVDR